MQVRYALYFVCAMALAVAACDGRRLNVLADRPPPISEDEIAGIDWSAPEDFRITLIEFAVLPPDPMLTLGRPYRLEIRNIGDKTFSIGARDFFETAVVRDMEVRYVELHGTTPHEEELIAQAGEFPTGLDSDPATTRPGNGDKSEAQEDGAMSEGMTSDTDTSESAMADDDKPQSEEGGAMSKEMKSDTGDSESAMAEGSDEAEPEPMADPIQVGLLSVPPSHAAVLTLVPLRAGRFPFIGAIEVGHWGNITVEDPAAQDDSAEEKDPES